MTRILSRTPLRRNVGLQTSWVNGTLARRMAVWTIQVGDRVINLQVPGLFTVIDRRGDLLVIQTPRGLRMTVLEQQVRRLDDVPTGSPSDE